MRDRLLGMACAALATVLAAHRAYASPSSRIVYSRAADAASCPDEEALRRAVAARVGYDVFFPWATRTIVATLSRADGVFVANVELVDEAGIRHGGHELKTHSDEACGELLDPLALAVTIAIDPKLLAPAATQPTPAPAPPPPTAPTAPGLSHLVSADGDEGARSTARLKAPRGAVQGAAGEGLRVDAQVRIERPSVRKE